MDGRSERNGGNRGPRGPGGAPRPGPKPLGEVLGRLFAARGYGRSGAVGELERAWADAVGTAAGGQTRLGGVRRGVLSVTVAHPSLLEELAAFRKADLLAALRQTGPGAAIREIRFRIGPVD